MQGGGQSGAAQQAAPAAQRSAQTLSLRLETPSPDQAQKFTRAVDAAAQKHTSVARHPTDCVYRPGVMSGNAAEVHTVAVQTLRQQQAGRPLPRPGWGKPPLHPGTLNHKRRRRGTTCQVSAMHLLTHSCSCSCLDSTKFMTDVHAHQPCISFQECMLLG